MFLFLTCPHKNEAKFICDTKSGKMSHILTPIRETNHLNGFPTKNPDDLCDAQTSLP